MIPRLYSESETNFNSNGICALSESVSAIVTEEANSIFTLELEYPIHGMWFSEIKRLRLIKALPNVGDEEHIFRIKEIVKSTNPKMVRIYASTKSEDLNGHIIKEFNREDTAANMVLSSLPASIYPPTNYLFHTDITTKVSPYWFMRNVTNSILGSEGSMVDLLGGGELKRNNDSLYLYRRRGRNNVTRVTPRKNLRGLEIIESTKGLITRIQPYMILQDFETDEKTVIIGDVVSSPFANNYPNQSVVPVDFSGYEFENKTQLDQRAASYFTSMNPDCDKPNVTLNLDLINLNDSSEYAKFKDFETVKLFDTVTVYVPRYDVDVLVKIVSVTFDVLREKVIKITAGQPVSSFIQDLNKTYDGKVSNVFETLKKDINTVRMSADGKTKVFTGPDEPDISISSEGDTWFKELGSGEMEIYIFDGTYWKVVINANTSKEILDKIDQAETDIAQNVLDIELTLAKANQAIIDAGFANSSITATDGKISSLEQNLEGFQQVVQNTYADKTTVTALGNQWTQMTELTNGHTGQITNLGELINLRVTQEQVDASILQGKRPIENRQATDDSPAWYLRTYGQQTVYELKDPTALGLGGAGTLETIVSSVTSSNGSDYTGIKQTYYQSNGDVYTRTGQWSETWSVWARVANTSNILSQINLSTEGVLIQGKKVQITGETYIDNGVIKTAHIADLAVSGAKIADASIGSAKIISLDAHKITTGTLDGITITGGDVYLRNSSGDINAGMSSAGTTSTSTRIWAGSNYAGRGSAQFRVQQNGKMIATDADISGKITSDTGTIGIFDIKPGEIEARDYAQNWHLRIGAPFSGGGKSPFWLGGGSPVSTRAMIYPDGAIQTFANLKSNSILPNNSSGIIGASDTNSRFYRIYLQTQPNVSSDIRQKNSIQDIPEGLIRKLKNLEPKMFKQNNNDDGLWHFGYIAQEVERVLYSYTLEEVGYEDAQEYVKDFAFLHKDESYLSLLYGEIAVLREKEIRDRIAKLELQIEELKGV